MIFRVGQIVEFIGGEEWIAAEVGAEATIYKITNEYNRNYIHIMWKRDSKWNNQGDGGYYPSDFKLKAVPGEQLLFSFMSDTDV